MRDMHIADMAAICASLALAYERDVSYADNYRKHFEMIKSGAFDPYDNLYDMGYERLVLAFRVLHTIENMIGD